jgi:hypothetical protein
MVELVPFFTTMIMVQQNMIERLRAEVEARERGQE